VVAITTTGSSGDGSTVLPSDSDVVRGLNFVLHCLASLFGDMSGHIQSSVHLCHPPAALRIRCTGSSRFLTCKSLPSFAGKGTCCDCSLPSTFPLRWPNTVRTSTELDPKGSIHYVDRSDSSSLIGQWQHEFVRKRTGRMRRAPHPPHQKQTVL